MKAFFIACGLLFPMLAGNADATTWYVNSTTGNDSFNGTTLGTPFLTLQRAANSTAAGDTVYAFGTFGGGTSGTPPLVISTSGTGAGTAANTPCTSQITYSGYPGAPKPIISSTQAAGVITGFNPLSCITINGFELAGSAGSLTWAGASINDAASGTGWQAALYNGDGIFISGTTGNTGSTSVHHIMITNNVIHDFNGNGVGIKFGDYITVAGNVVYNNTNYAPWADSGISLYELHQIDSGTGTKNVISGNTVYNNVNLVINRNSGLTTTTTTASASTGASTLSVASTSGVNFTQTFIDGSTGCIPPYTTVQSWVSNTSVTLTNAITCNIANGATIGSGYVTDGEGIIIDNNTNTQSDSVAYIGRTLVTNNAVFNNGSSGIQVSPGSINTDVTFNTNYQNQAYFDYGAGWFAGAAPGEFNVYQAAGTNIYNNVVVSPGTSVPSCWDNNTTTTVWSNNVCYNGSATNPIPGTNNITTNPLMISASTNPTTANFQLAPGSPAIGAGSTAYSRTLDIAGNPGIFLAFPDIGAYSQACPSYGTYAYLQTPGIGSSCRSR